MAETSIGRQKKNKRVLLKGVNKATLKPPFVIISRKTCGKPFVKKFRISNKKFLDLNFIFGEAKKTNNKDTIIIKKQRVAKSTMPK